MSTVKAENGCGWPIQICSLVICLLDFPVLYLSKYIIEHKNDYYRNLRSVTEKNLWETWILFMLKAVEQTAVFTRERIIAIRDLMSQTTEKATKTGMKVCDCRQEVNKETASLWSAQHRQHWPNSLSGQ